MPYAEPEWMSEFRQKLLDLDSRLTELKTSNLDIEQACALLVDLNTLKGELGLIYDSFSGTVSEVMANETEVMLENGAKIEKRWSNKRSGWQHRDLASAVASRITNMAVDMDTGEIVMSQEQMIINVLDYVQPSYWRIKELEKIGINADQYCEVGETKTSIIVRKGNVK